MVAAAFVEHYNHCLDTLEDVRAMFAALEKYRKSKDKRDLFKTHELENKIKAEIKKLQNENQLITSNPCQ